MAKRRCSSCGRRFEPCAHVPRQRYCSAPACQRERRRHWQQRKRREDPDYRDNQRQAQQRWAQRHPDYWREYRQRHAEYRERNRQQQQRRNQQRRVEPGKADDTGAQTASSRRIAKMDASITDSVVPSGTYYLIAETSSDDCKDGRVNAGYRCLIKRLE